MARFGPTRLVAHFGKLRYIPIVCTPVRAAGDRGFDDRPISPHQGCIMGLILSLAAAWPFLLLISILLFALWHIFRSSPDLPRHRQLALSGVTGAILVSILMMLNILSARSELAAHDAEIEALRQQYDARKSESEQLRERYERSARDLEAANQVVRRMRTEAEQQFERSAREIRKAYAGISDRELADRIDAILAQARQRLHQQEKRP